MVRTFGDSVNVAARMAGLALSGHALTTVDTVAALSAHLREAMRRLDALPVKAVVITDPMTSRRHAKMVEFGCAWG